MSASTIAQRLQFVGIDHEVLATLRQSRELVLGAMPAILDGFYRHLGRFSETASVFKTPEHVAAAKALQLRHWTIILEGRFDENYENSVISIGKAHQRMGIEPRWYIGAYNLLLAGLIEAVALDTPVAFFGRGAERGRTALQVALSKAALLDMDLAISVYTEAGIDDRKSTLATLAEEFERTIGDVVDVVAREAVELERAARTMTDAATRTAARTEAASAASGEASTNVEAVAAASEQLSKSIGEISRRVNETAEVSNGAARDAEITREKMGRLSEGVQKIGSIVDLIANVAEQTNLLALNATIEAARAGDAGRGFAVVAQEVKSLAEQTAKATADIAANIAELQSATTESSHSIAAVTGVMERLRELTSIIAAAVEEQGAATNEITRNVQQAAEGTGNTSMSLVDISRDAGQAGSAAAGVLTSAAGLSQQADILRGEVDRFLATVRLA